MVRRKLLKILIGCPNGLTIYRKFNQTNVDLQKIQLHCDLLASVPYRLAYMQVLRIQTTIVEIFVAAGGSSFYESILTWSGEFNATDPDTNA